MSLLFESTFDIVFYILTHRTVVQTFLTYSFVLHSKLDGLLDLSVLNNDNLFILTYQKLFNMFEIVRKLLLNLQLLKLLNCT